MSKPRDVKDMMVVLSKHKQELLDQYHVQKIGIFGSFARNEAIPVSDVDILVELNQAVGWEIVDLHQYLEQITGMKVDLITEGALAKRPLLRRSIEEDLVYA